ncbi:MAG: hypothetical protein IJ489_09695 [Clostridia bacterium]|nr:hypothetical protein [Clostridia bacterium]
MKKTILCVFLIFAVLMVSACAEEKPDVPENPERVTLDAVIEKIYEKTLYVRILDETEDYLFVSRCDTVTQDGEQISSDILTAGDGIQIVYDGQIKGKSPAQIANVYEIILTKAHPVQ